MIDKPKKPLTKGAWIRMDRPKRRHLLLISSLVQSSRDHYRLVTHADIAKASDCSVSTVFKLLGAKVELEDSICRFALEQYENQEDAKLRQAAHQVLLQMTVGKHPLARHLRVELHHKQEKHHEQKTTG